MPRRKAILARCPELQAACETGLPGIAGFANGLEHHLDAVTSGLTLP